MDEKLKEELADKYKEKGFHQISLEEYEVLRKEKTKREQREIPKAIKIMVAIPMYIIAAFGAILIPYILFLIITSPMEDPAKEKKKSVSLDQLKKRTK